MDEYEFRMAMLNFTQDFMSRFDSAIVQHNYLSKDVERQRWVTEKVLSKVGMDARRGDIEKETKKAIYLWDEIQKHLKGKV